MSYTFRGVFIERPHLSERELETLFGGYARSIETPFIGVVLSLRADLDEENMENHVLEWSRQIPNSRVAFIHYVCWGGSVDSVCGFGCRNGELLKVHEREAGPVDYANIENLRGIRDDIFKSLLEFVGAQSPPHLFAPFERGYFPNT